MSIVNKIHKQKTWETFIPCVISMYTHFQHSNVYVKRSGKFQHEKAIKQLDLIVKDKVPVRLHLVLYFRIRGLV